MNVCSKIKVEEMFYYKVFKILLLIGAFILKVHFCQFWCQLYIRKLMKKIVNKLWIKPHWSKCSICFF